MPKRPRQSGQATYQQRSISPSSQEECPASTPGQPESPVSDGFQVKLDDENPTVGIILCKIKNDALVELTLPKDANVYASRYQVYLPSKEELKKRLIEWSEDAPGAE